MKPLKLVFMGTPEFALPSLDLLYLSVHSIEALVAPPDKPFGRGHKIRYAPTKQWAQRQGIKLIQPDDLNEAKFIKAVKAIQPDLIITVAFGRILSSELLGLPLLGCINLHASYLPAYRGAAPIHRAIIEGATYSGASIIFMTGELDAGDIIIQEKEPISNYDTAGMLHDRLALRGASLLIRAIDALAGGSLDAIPQDHTTATYAPPLAPEDERINWEMSAHQIYNQIRGLNPWPGAYTTYEDKRIKVWKAAVPSVSAESSGGQLPGTILAVGDNSLTVAAGEGSLTLLDLQPAGKKSMDAGSFCCGYRIEPGSRLNSNRA